MGLRFRVNHSIALPGTRSVRADIVFPAYRLAIFVDGCFWHSCPQHGRVPTLNNEYWSAKLAANAERDNRVSKELQGAGWRVMRIWEHAPATEAADAVASWVGGTRIGTHERGRSPA